MATVRCVWKSEINRAAGASWTLWSTDPAWATAVPSSWAPKGLLILSRVEGRGWTRETPGKGTAALAAGECENVCREKAGQHRDCGLTSAGIGGRAGCSVLGKPGVDLVHPEACCCCLLLGFLCWFL